MPVTQSGQIELVEVDTDVLQVVASTTEVQVVTIGIQGPVGPQGPAGPATPGTTYVFEQNTPATTWTIVHNLGQYPSVTVVDSGGSVVIGAVDYIDTNTCVVSFTMAFGGRAYLN